jgi:beta-lactam-binding protein with PASTA domain
MPGPFTITAATHNAHVDATRRGEAFFTVFNASGGPIRGQAQIRTEDPAAAAWLSVRGDAEWDFDVAGTQQITVQIAAPPDAPAGRYPFRLTMVGVENPDELFSEGPSVTFDVTEVEEEKEPFPWWLAAIVAGVLVIGAVIAGTAISLTNVKIPRVRGLTIAQASDAIEDAGLQVAGESIETYNDDLTQGLVLDTDPSTVKQVRRGTVITLIVSGGPEPIPLPDVTDRTRADAREILESACSAYPCVHVIVQLEPSADVDRGRVIRTDPAQGTGVPPGSDVTIFVSSGPPRVEVPDLTGATLSQAESALRDAGLQAGQRQEEKSIDIAEDHVIRTDPSAGTEVEEGTSVALVVSSGRPIIIRQLVTFENGNPEPDLVRWRCQDSLVVAVCMLQLQQEPIEIQDGRDWTARTLQNLIQENGNLAGNTQSQVVDDFTLQVAFTSFGPFSERRFLEALSEIKIPVYVNE